MNLGNTIVLLRERKELNQGELATKLGISQTYLSQIENNKKMPTIGMLENIGKVLSTPLPFLFFLSIDAEDIPIGKRPDYETVGHHIKDFITAMLYEK